VGGIRPPPQDEKDYNKPHPGSSCQGIDETGFHVEVLKEDKRAIFTAASHAQKAAGHLHSYQPVPVHPDPEVVKR